MFLHYHQMDKTKINATGGSGSGPDAALDEAASMTLYFASIFFSVPEIIFGTWPKKPPDGITTLTIMFATTISSCIASCALIAIIC